MILSKIKEDRNKNLTLVLHSSGLLLNAFTTGSPIFLDAKATLLGLH